jgi:hypothetical protein
MEEFAAGTDVFITFAHSNNGSELNVTDLQYQVLDSAGEVLIDYATAPSFDPAATSTIITILKQFNATQDKIDVRQVNVALVTSAGTYKQTVYYKLIGDVTKLTPMVDSYMTFPESVIVRAKMSDQLEYFDALPDNLKAVALENSFANLKKLRFNPAITGSTSRCSTTGLDISAYSYDQFKTLPIGLQNALKKAQIAEANVLVENSPIRDKIRAGIISETIGESSMFFKQGGSVGGTKYPGLSDDAYAHLSEFVFKSATNAQIWHLRRA